MRKWTWLLTILVLTAPLPTFAESFQDSQICRALAEKHQFGLSILSQSGMLQPVNGSRIDYDSSSRLYYIQNARATREVIWTVRTRTTARSAKANHTLLWRPEVITVCSGGRPLEVFQPNERLVSLQRYYQHHAPPGQRKRDDELSRKFHMPMKAHDGRCTSRTDDENNIGPLENVYRFDDVAPGPLLVEHFREPQSASAEITSKKYSGLTSEIAPVSEGQLMCFGFSVPLPTRLGVGAQALGGIGGWFAAWDRYAVSVEAAHAWQPSETSVTLRQLNGPGHDEYWIKWTPQR